MSDLLRETPPVAAPPHDADLEAKVLGLMVRFPSTVQPVLETGIGEHAFHVPRFARAFRAIVDLVDMGQPVDPHHLAARLGDRDLAAEVTATVSDSGPWVTKKWARLLIDLAACRRVIAPAHAVHQAARAGCWDEVLARFDMVREVVARDVA